MPHTLVRHISKNISKKYFKKIFHHITFLAKLWVLVLASCKPPLPDRPSTNAVLGLEVRAAPSSHSIARNFPHSTSPQPPSQIPPIHTIWRRTTTRVCDLSRLSRSREIWNFPRNIAKIWIFHEKSRNLAFSRNFAIFYVEKDKKCHILGNLK